LGVWKENRGKDKVKRERRRGEERKSYELSLLFA
jgi:hypothetical protein